MRAQLAIEPRRSTLDVRMLTCARRRCRIGFVRRSRTRREHTTGERSNDFKFANDVRDPAVKRLHGRVSGLKRACWPRRPRQGIRRFAIRGYEQQRVLRHLNGAALRHMCADSRRSVWHFQPEQASRSCSYNTRSPSLQICLSDLRHGPAAKRFSKRVSRFQAMAPEPHRPETRIKYVAVRRHAVPCKAR